MFRLLSLTIIGIALIYAIEGAIPEKFITGKITYAGPSVIDKNLRIEVALRDITLMEVASKLIASTVISDAKTFPVSYSLQYFPSDIKTQNTYALNVKITGPDSKLLFTNDVQTRVEFTGSTSPVVDIRVIRVGGSSEKCGPVQCHGKPKHCRYGYEKKDGCEICKCFDPCRPYGKPFYCEPNQRCSIEKKPDGIYEARCKILPLTKFDDGKMNSEIVCKQPKVAGTCKASMKRYYYNSATKTCDLFLYSGCDGNENNFVTEDECKKLCKV